MCLTSSKYYPKKLIVGTEEAVDYELKEDEYETENDKISISGSKPGSSKAKRISSKKELRTSRKNRGITTPPVHTDNNNLKVPPENLSQGSIRRNRKAETTNEKPKITFGDKGVGLFLEDGEAEAYLDPEQIASSLKDDDEYEDVGEEEILNANTEPKKSSDKQMEDKNSKTMFKNYSENTEEERLAKKVLAHMRRQRKDNILNRKRRVHYRIQKTLGKTKLGSKRIDVIPRQIKKFELHISPNIGQNTIKLSPNRNLLSLGLDDSHLVVLEDLAQGNLLDAKFNLVNSFNQDLQTFVPEPMFTRNINFRFDSITSMYLFVKIKEKEDLSLDLMRHLRFSMHFENDDNLLYRARSISRYLEEMTTYNSSVFYPLKHTRNFFKCNTTGKILVDTQLLTVCNNNGTTTYHLFVKGSKKVFKEIKQLRNCENFVWFSRRKVGACVSNSNLAYFYLKDNELHQIVITKPMKIQKGYQIYRSQMKNNYLTSYYHFQQRGFTSVSVDLFWLDNQVFNEIKKFYNFTIDLLRQKFMFFIHEEEYIVIISETHINVYFVDVHLKQVIRTKISDLNFNGENIYIDKSFAPKVLFYKDSLLAGAENKNEESELLISFMGCFAGRCGIFLYSVQSTLIESFKDFIDLSSQSTFSSTKYIWNYADIFSKQGSEDLEIRFRGFFLLKLLQQNSDNSVRQI